jgi:hypothetical protein
MKPRTTLLAFLLLASASLCWAADVTGLKITHSAIAESNVALTLTNTTEKAVTAWSIEISGTKADGSVLHSRHTRDYGPHSLFAGIAPGKTIPLVIPIDKGAGNVQVRVAAVVYEDKTAEVWDESALQNIVAHRTAAAKRFHDSGDLDRAAAWSDAAEIRRAQ